MNPESNVGFFDNIKNDLPASIVVFLVAVPLCLGIALASGAPLFSGIIAGIVGCIADLISLKVLEDRGMEGIIVGRALYDGSINLNEAIRTFKNLSFQDSFNNKKDFIV